MEPARVSAARSVGGVPVAGPRHALGHAIDPVPVAGLQRRRVGLRAGHLHLLGRDAAVCLPPVFLRGQEGGLGGLRLDA